MTDQETLDVPVEISHEPPAFDLDSDPDGLDSHRASTLAARLRAGEPDDELRSLETVDESQVKLLEHQVDAAHRALFQMDGTALLADEVGLGKTIEVGMILKEMHYRATSDSVLVLTPAQLAPQWQGELREKFGLEFVCNYDDEFEGFDAHDYVLASIDTAKSDRHRETVLARDWDVLVVDEAHYLKNETTDRYDLVDRLQYDYAFFLTATPIQNDPTDLYNLVTLLRPGLFGSRESFDRYFQTSDDGDQTTLVDREELHDRLSEVMIRNRRAETGVDFTDRVVETRTFEPTDAERRLYEATTDYVQTAYAEAEAQKLVAMLLQKEVVSSPEALAATVRRKLAGGDDETDGAGSDNDTGSDDSDTAADDTESVGVDDDSDTGDTWAGAVDGASADTAPRHPDRLRSLLETAESVDRVTKRERLFEVVDEVRERVSGGHVVVFTAFRATQRALVDALTTRGYETHTFHGGHDSAQKEATVAAFEADGGVLVSTDAMNEGRNLQFCNVLVNYDLPWNPMRVEQRIGRVHRIGQRRQVYVFNLALEDTVEEYVLDKLFHKIDLFQQTVGETSQILSGLAADGRSFEDAVFERLVDADSEVALENDFDELAVDLQEQTALSQKVEQFNDDVFERFDLGVDGD
ncbi:DEAD/DEAH box helicase [Halobaculum sp. MBLA0143]|uniref:DEAD/DEAH box helicase n=1 Tax=Halobaculum sp. MBLA0143 TaxID=3079933 RepID=UPI00352325CA